MGLCPRGHIACYARAVRALCTNFVQEQTQAGYYYVVPLIVTLVLYLYELYVCFSLMWGTFLYVVVAIEAMPCHAMPCH